MALCCILIGCVLFPAGNCTSNLRVIRSRWRRWAMKHRPARNRRAKRPPAESAIKPSLPMAVATSVLIAKPSSVHAVGDESRYAPIRYSHNIPLITHLCSIWYTNIRYVGVLNNLLHTVQYILYILYVWSAPRVTTMTTRGRYSLCLYQLPRPRTTAVSAQKQLI